jgi:uncharacterized membrane protein (UPF0182 family)
VSRRRTGLLAALAVIVLLLFLGRWTAVVLADRWWAAQFSPDAATFLTGWHLLLFTIDATACLLGWAWYTGNLLSLTRAVGSVQIPRHVGNLEFREAVRPGTLLSLAVALGLLLGLLSGMGKSAHWRAVALASESTRWGQVEPLLGRDAGTYVTRLPLLQLVQDFALTLALVGFALCLVLYSVIGAVRLERRMPAINDHARVHLGLLLAVLAAVLAAGFALEPSSYVAAAGGAPTASGFRRVALVAPSLTGTALMAALLSAAWAFTGRHALLAAGWAVLAAATVLGRVGVPLVARTAADTPLADSAYRAFEDGGFGLNRVRAAELPGVLAAPVFEREVIRTIFPEATPPIGVWPASRPVGGEQRPVWIALVEGTDAQAIAYVIAADHTGAGGVPLSFPASDSLGYPTLYAAGSLGADAIRSGAPEPVAVGAPRGAQAVGAIRRAVLSWALQKPSLLSGDGSGSRIDWALDPRARLEKLAPYAAWGAPRLALSDGRLTWIGSGYVSSQTWPLVARRRWIGGDANYLDAGFAGLVDAASGRVRIVLRERAGPLAAAWASLAGDMVERELPGDGLNAGAPPLELFAVQSQLVAKRRGLELAPQPDAQPVLQGWDSTGALVLVVPLRVDRQGRVAGLLVGRTNGDLLWVDTEELPPLDPEALGRLWGRFATYAPVQDSLAAAGATTRSGRVYYFKSDSGLAALQVVTAARPGARPAVIWVNVAIASRAGAGRTFELAWRNLLGGDAPLPPAAGEGDALGDARYWLQVADEALKRGDFTAFGRAFDALRQTLTIQR